jgi:hypothetical protein
MQIRAVVESDAVRERPAAPNGEPKLLDRVRESIRARHYSRRTEIAYVRWVKRYNLFHGARIRSRWARPK